MVDYEELWLRKKINYLANGNNGRLVFLGFLLTLNIAVYSAIFSINPGSLWEPLRIRIFLSALLAIVNVVVFVIYLREHNREHITGEEVDLYLLKKAGFDQKKSMEIINVLPPGNTINEVRQRIKARDLMKNWTWIMLKVLFFMIMAIPISYLVFLLLDFSDLNLFLRKLIIFIWQYFKSIIELRSFLYFFLILAVCVFFSFVVHFIEYKKVKSIK